jgi:hypothetical protein
MPQPFRFADRTGSSKGTICITLLSRPVQRDSKPGDGLVSVDLFDDTLVQPSTMAETYPFAASAHYCSRCSKPQPLDERG